MPRRAGWGKAAKKGEEYEEMSEQIGDSDEPEGGFSEQEENVDDVQQWREDLRIKLKIKCKGVPRDVASLHLLFSQMYPEGQRFAGLLRDRLAAMADLLRLLPKPLMELLPDHMPHSHMFYTDLIEGCRQLSEWDDTDPRDRRSLEKTVVASILNSTKLLPTLLRHCHQNEGAAVTFGEGLAAVMRPLQHSKDNTRVGDQRDIGALLYMLLLFDQQEHEDLGVLSKGQRHALDALRRCPSMPDALVGYAFTSLSRRGSVAQKLQQVALMLEEAGGLDKHSLKELNSIRVPSLEELGMVAQIIQTVLEISLDDQGDGQDHADLTPPEMVTNTTMAIQAHLEACHVVIATLMSSEQKGPQRVTPAARERAELLQEHSRAWVGACQGVVLCRTGMLSVLRYPPSQGIEGHKRKSLLFLLLQLAEPSHLAAAPDLVYGVLANTLWFPAPSLTESDQKLLCGAIANSGVCAHALDVLGDDAALEISPLEVGAAAAAMAALAEWLPEADPSVQGSALKSTAKQMLENCEAQLTKLQLQTALTPGQQDLEENLVKLKKHLKALRSWRQAGRARKTSQPPSDAMPVPVADQELTASVGNGAHPAHNPAAAVATVDQQEPQQQQHDAVAIHLTGSPPQEKGATEPVSRRQRAPVHFTEVPQRHLDSAADLNDYKRAIREAERQGQRGGGAATAIKRRASGEASPQGRDGASALEPPAKKKGRPFGSTNAVRAAAAAAAAAAVSDDDEDSLQLVQTRNATHQAKPVPSPLGLPMSPSLNSTDAVADLLRSLQRSSPSLLHALTVPDQTASQVLPTNAPSPSALDPSTLHCPILVPALPPQHAQTAGEDNRHTEPQGGDGSAAASDVKLSEATTSALAANGDDAAMADATEVITKACSAVGGAALVESLPASKGQGYFNELPAAGMDQQLSEVELRIVDQGFQQAVVAAYSGASPLRELSALQRQVWMAVGDMRTKKDTPALYLWYCSLRVAYQRSARTESWGRLRETLQAMLPDVCWPQSPAA